MPDDRLLRGALSKVAEKARSDEEWFKQLLKNPAKARDALTAAEWTDAGELVTAKIIAARDYCAQVGGQALWRMWHASVGEDWPREDWPITKMEDDWPPTRPPGR